MAECQGTSEHCQDCGMCTVEEGGLINASPNGNELVDKIVLEVIKNLNPSSQSMGQSVYKPIPLGVSNHHIHLTKETFQKLFGVDQPFEVYRELYQPGEFASKHTCIIVGPKLRPITGVRILGPFRKYDQVEISLTDAITLGIKPPVRDSGALKGSAPITIVGPKGTVHLSEGAIRANRHVHMPTADAEQFGIKAGDWIKVRVAGEKATTFENVLVRTNDAWKLQLHLDTDDANAAGVVCDTKVEFAGKM